MKHIPLKEGISLGILKEQKNRFYGDATYQMANSWLSEIAFNLVRNMFTNA
jgi:hypothetical protein